ncbi:MAG: APC family permease [Solirubrobacteraceae bacterium]
MAAPTSSARDDTADLAEFGYAQSLHRRLHFFSSFAAAFSYISPATGIFTLFILGIGTLGGAFIWTFPVVAAGQFMVALVFAEVSSHFPLAGSVFQWTKLLSNSKPYAWFSGWIYLWAGALTVAAVVATLPLTLIPVINDIGISDMAPDSLVNQKWIAIITLVVITLLNIFGVRVVAIINNTGVLFELLGLFVFAIILALFHNNQGVGVVFHTGGPDFSAGNFLVAMFMGLFVIYGFDTASTLAEETNDPRRVAPRAVLGSIVAALIIGFVFLWAMLMAVPGSLSKAVAAGGISPPEIIQANLSDALATGYLLVVSFAIFVCCLAIQASTIRLAYSMARDQQLPGSKGLSVVHPGTGTPVGACILVALLAGIFFLKYGGVAYIAIAASGMIYISYLLANLAILQARRRGFFERRDVPFSLGRWGMALNILALAWGGAMLINFMWHRVATNPKPNETDGVLDFGVGFIDKLPIQWSVIGGVLILGAIYYGLRSSHIPSPVRSAERAAGTPG